MRRSRLSPEAAAIRDRVIGAWTKLGEAIIREDANPRRGPRTLTHYTSAEGLVGIVDGGRLWTSRADCLNDTRELHYGLDLADDIVREYAKQSSKVSDHGLAGRFLEELQGDPADRSPWIGGIFKLDPYVACFCEDDDLLGQWAYFARDGGYNIGFVRTRLVGAIEEPFKADLFRVIYGRDRQRRLLWNCIERFAESVVNELRSESLAHQKSGVATAVIMCQTSLRVLAARMKSASFKPEKEWRLIAYRKTNRQAPGPEDEKDTKLLRFRPVGSRVVPYYEAQFGPRKMPISFVTVGPTVDWAVAKESVGDLLHKHGYDRDSVRRSLISLR